MANKPGVDEQCGPSVSVHNLNTGVINMQTKVECTMGA